MSDTITGYKGFNKDMKCRDMQYSLNKEFKEDVNPEVCERGLHFCPMPLDVFDFYEPDGQNQFAEVEGSGKVVQDDIKAAASVLKVKGKISIAGMFKAHFDIIKKKISESVKESIDTVSTSEIGAHANTAGDAAHANTAGGAAHANTAGYRAHANTAGYGAHANTAGYGAHANTAGDAAHANTAGGAAHANTAGDRAHANTAGDAAHANTAGDRAHANTAGYGAHANTAGDAAHANTAGGAAHANTAGYRAHANTAGDNSIASSLGIHSRSKASKGWIVIVDWRHNLGDGWWINEIYRAKVGIHEILGTKIEPDVWYWMEEGELKSEK